MFSENEKEFPDFDIMPVLKYYGGADAAAGRGWTSYRCPFPQGL